MGIVGSYEWTFIFLLAYSLAFLRSHLISSQAGLLSHWLGCSGLGPETIQGMSCSPQCSSPAPTKHLPLCLGGNEAGVQTSEKAPSSQTSICTFNSWHIGFSASGLPNVITNEDPFQASCPGQWPTVPHSHCSLRYLQSWFIPLPSSELAFSVILCPNSAHPSKPGLHGITPSKHPLVEWALSTLSTLQPLHFLPSLPLSQTTLYHSYLGSSWLSQPLDSKLLGYGALPSQFVCDPLSKV